MPEIIDNIKVGELIKKLLKEKNMTQNDLATLLNISRSAVSQNLSGKSTFDTQNLMKISKIFEISLDVLLSMKSGEDRNIISEYDRMVRKGLEEIQEIEEEMLNIWEPDIYGKVLVEYVIEYDKIDILKYLLNSRIKLFSRYHHNNKVVYFKIIHYMLVKKLDGVLNFIYEFVQFYGSFKIDNEELEEMVFIELNNKEAENIVSEILTKVVKSHIAFAKFANIPKNIKVLSNKEWIYMIAKYRLDNLFLKYIEAYNPFDDCIYLITKFIEFGYTAGLNLLIKNTSIEKLNIMNLKQIKAQEAAFLISETNNLDLFKKFITKKIYLDYNDLICKLIHGNKKELYNCMIDSKIEELDYRKIGLNTVTVSNLQLAKKLLKNFSQDDLDYLLNRTIENDYKVMILLINKGAKFIPKYYNIKTNDRINNLLKHLLNKEGK